MKNWFHSLLKKLADKAAHEPDACSSCRNVLALLRLHGPLYGLELVERGNGLKRGTVYIHLSQLEARGFVERCWGRSVGPGEPYREVRLKQYIYRLTEAP